MKDFVDHRTVSVAMASIVKPRQGPSIVTSSGKRARLGRAARIAVVLAIVFGALAAGLRLRQWMWVATDTPHPSMRFDYDIENAFHWGSTVLGMARERAVEADRGGRATDWRYFIPAYLGLYDEVIRQHPDGDYQLDYTPARLLVAALWVRHERLVYPHVRDWMRPYDFNAPLLRLNTICELLSALGAFLLVRHWVWRGTLPPEPLYRRRRRNAAPPPPLPRAGTRAWVLGLIAALLIWFNPALLFDAHVFPQWEVWLLPFFFFAAWLASRNWWLTAGLLIPFGMMMKGQLSIVLLLFILWPIFEGRPGAAARFILGCVLAAGVMLSPWLLHANFGWMKVSFEYPTHHWQIMGGVCDNLPALLEAPPFGWQLADPVFTLRIPWVHIQKIITIKTFLVVIYGICLVLCSWGAARKSRRNDAAFLIALTAPWLLMFAILTQMHERYLLWAAVVSATTIAVGLGWGLLHLLLSAIATSMIVRLLLQFGGNRPHVLRLNGFLQSLHPGIAWAVLLCAAIYLYCAVAPHRKKARLDLAK
jgi:hypothetical protein